MIAFERMGLLERIKRVLSPSYRRKRDAEMKEALRYLVENPGVPCMVDGEIIPDGYGYNPPRYPF